MEKDNGEAYINDQALLLKTRWLGTAQVSRKIRDMFLLKRRGLVRLLDRGEGTGLKCNLDGQIKR